MLEADSMLVKGLHRSVSICQITLVTSFCEKSEDWETAWARFIDVTKQLYKLITIDLITRHLRASLTSTASLEISVGRSDGSMYCRVAMKLITVLHPAVS